MSSNLHQIEILQEIDIDELHYLSGKIAPIQKILSLQEHWKKFIKTQKQDHKILPKTF